MTTRHYVFVAPAKAGAHAAVARHSGHEGWIAFAG